MREEISGMYVTEERPNTAIIAENARNVEVSSFLWVRISASDQVVTNAKNNFGATRGIYQGTELKSPNYRTLPRPERSENPNA